MASYCRSQHKTAGYVPNRSKTTESEPQKKTLGRPELIPSPRKASRAPQTPLPWGWLLSILLSVVLLMSLARLDPTCGAKLPQNQVRLSENTKAATIEKAFGPKTQAKQEIQQNKNVQPELYQSMDCCVNSKQRSLLTDGAIAGAQHHAEVVTSKIGSCCYYKRSSSMAMGKEAKGKRPRFT